VTDPTASRRALGAALLATLFLSFGPIFVRKAGIGGLAFAVHRLWLASAVYIVVLALRGRRLTFATLRASAPGGVMFAFNVATFFVGVRRTSVANATIIGALQPVALLMIVNRLFGERPGRRDALWTAVAIAGVALVVFGSSTARTGDALGDFLAFIAMLGYVGYFVASKQARRTLDTVEYQAALSVVATIALVPVAVVSGERLAPPDASTWIWIAAMVALPGTGHLLTNYALAHIRLSTVSVLTLFNPVGAALLAWLLLDQRLVAWQLIGIAVVMIGLGSMVTAAHKGVIPLGARAG
jgi:drug/metabolite transporter (DMT)-like permease